MRWFIMQWTWACNNVGCALAVWNRNGQCSLYWLLNIGGGTSSGDGWIWEVDRWTSSMSFGCLINNLIYVGFSYNISMHFGFKFNWRTEYVYCGYIRYGHCGHVGYYCRWCSGTHNHDWDKFLIGDVGPHVKLIVIHGVSSLSNANGSWGLSKLNFPPPCPPSLSLYEGLKSLH